MRTNNIAGKINFYLSGMPDMDSARPHDLLCQMEELEDALIKMCNHLNAQIDYGDVILEELPKLSTSFGEDLLLKLEEEQEFLADRYTDLLDVKAYLSENPDILRPHDSLPELLDKSVDTIKSMFDQQELLRWAIMEHNVDHEAKGEPKLLSSPDEVDDFFSSL